MWPGFILALCLNVAAWLYAIYSVAVMPEDDPRLQGHTSVNYRSARSPSGASISGKNHEKTLIDARLTRMLGVFLAAARLDVPPDALGSYLSGLPVVSALAKAPLRFEKAITVVTGENGAGKSTLIESLAAGMRLNPEGGSRHANFTSLDEKESLSPLYRWLTLSRPRNPRDAFFLRGESFYNLAGYYAGLEPVPKGPRMDDLLEMSHGQSLMALIERRFHSEGLFLLDEPEAGLSMLRQLELMGRLHHLAAQGSQIILATHSPILMAIPGAQLLEITEEGISYPKFEETQAVQAAREFIGDPEGTVAFLTEEA